MRHSHTFSAPRVLAAASVLLVVACTESATAPQIEETDAFFSKRPSQPSPRIGEADPEWVEVCLIDDTPQAPNKSYKIEWAVDIDNDGVMDGIFFHSQLKHRQCEDLWIHGTTTFDRVKIFLIAKGLRITSQTRTVTRPVPGDPSQDIFVDGPVISGNRADGFANGTTGTLTVFTIKP